MAYRDFDRDDDLELEFYVAERLGMTVARLRVDMTNDEFVRWAVYHGRRAQRAQLDAEAAGARP